MRAVPVVCVCILFWNTLGAALPREQGTAAKPVIAEEEFALRRSALCAHLDSASAALFRASDPKWRNGDVNYPYRQESNYLYLTGEASPSGILVVVPRGITLGTLHGRIVHVGGKVVKDSVAGEELFVRGDRLKEVVESVATNSATLYVSAPDLRFVNDWLNDKGMFLERDARREFEQAHPGVKIKNATALMGGYREVKSQAELNMMRRAIAVTGDGFKRALRICKPGAFEYELQAAVESGMRRGGAEGLAFPSIIGSGPNSLIPHYEENNRQMQKGDVVVMDIGAEFGGYAADVTRTIPVSGVYTPEQKKIYSIVRTAHDEVIKLIRPGVPSRLLEEKARQIITDAGYARFILHGISHKVGLDVHDAGVSDTLRAGMVITVEPGIYTPVEEPSLARGYRCIGIRLEDDVLVTPTGAEILTAAIPIDPATIEKLMK